MSGKKWLVQAMKLVKRGQSGCAMDGLYKRPPGDNGYRYRIGINDIGVEWTKKAFAGLIT
jgi:hypothetical protein